MDTEDHIPRIKSLIQALALEDLGAHSLDELDARIAALEAEIDRCRATMASKRQVLGAAETMFKKP